MSGLHGIDVAGVDGTQPATVEATPDADRCRRLRPAAPGPQCLAAVSVSEPSRSLYPGLPQVPPTARRDYAAKRGSAVNVECRLARAWGTNHLGSDIELISASVEPGSV
jgi:hypothetical protein